MTGAIRTDCRGRWRVIGECGGQNDGKIAVTSRMLKKPSMTFSAHPVPLSRLPKNERFSAAC